MKPYKAHKLAMHVMLKLNCICHVNGKVHNFFFSHWFDSMWSQFSFNDFEMNSTFYSHNVSWGHEQRWVPKQCQKCNIEHSLVSMSFSRDRENAVSATFHILGFCEYETQCVDAKVKKKDLQYTLLAKIWV